VVIRARQLQMMTPVLEGVLSKVTAEHGGLEADISRRTTGFFAGKTAP
jgi:hypothetical protein